LVRTFESLDGPFTWLACLAGWSSGPRRYTHGRPRWTCLLKSRYVG
jgi:hypothetical protein